VGFLERKSTIRKKNGFWLQLSLSKKKKRRNPDGPVTRGEKALEEADNRGPSCKAQGRKRDPVGTIPK